MRHFQSDPVEDGLNDCRFMQLNRDRKSVCCDLNSVVPLLLVLSPQLIELPGTKKGSQIAGHSFVNIDLILILVRWQIWVVMFPAQIFPNYPG